MKTFIVVVVLLGAALLLTRLVQAAGKTLEAGDPAPDFALSDQHGQAHRLEDYRGEWLVLYFYPKDGTPVCTREACAFRDGYRELRALGARVLGASLDDRGSHAEFATRHGLPFPLLSDGNGRVARAYGTLWSFGPIRFTKRHTFLIDPGGRIARVYRKVDAERHAGEVVKDLEAMR